MSPIWPKPSQVGWLGAVHLAVSLVLYTLAWVLALRAFERDPSAGEDAIVAVGAAAGFPLVYALGPMLAVVVPKGAALLVACVANSVLWGYALALGLNAARRLRRVS